MDEKSIESLHSLWHPLLAILIPFSLLQAFDALIRQGVLAGIMQTPPIGFLAVVAAVGVSSAVTTNIFHRQRITGVLPRVREGLIFLIACFILLMLLSGLPFKGDFDPRHTEVAWPLALCVAQWIFTNYTHSLLRRREYYLRSIVGKSGRELFLASRALSEEARSAVEGIAKLKNALAGFTIIAVGIFFVLTVTLAAGGKAASPGVVLRVCVTVLCWMVFLSVLNGYLREQDFW
jgi:uncharacterized membrane protein